MDNALYKPIIEFFESRKEKEQIDFPTYEEKLAAVKNLLKTWLVDTANKINGMAISTHPCTFIHPSANNNKILVTEKTNKGKIKSKAEKVKTTPIIAKNQKANDGYVRTGNVADLAYDALGNAAVIGYYKFINIILSDGQSILEHIEKDTQIAKELLSNTNKLTYEELKQGILSVKNGSDVICTSSKIKQVYFPVENDYHLLSVLMPSGIMNKLNNRIKTMKFSENTKELRNLRKNNSYADGQLQDIYELTMVGYGGTKPQNISILNNENAGKFYYLNCLVPFLKPQKLRLPKSNFFNDILWANAYRSQLNALHNLMKIPINNTNIRLGRDKIILFILEDIFKKIWLIRASSIGWSNQERCLNLPKHQKFLLDDTYLEERITDKEYMLYATKKFSTEMARWLINSYNKILGQEAILLADEELKYINDLILNESEVLL